MFKRRLKMKRISKKRLNEFIDRVAHIGPSNVPGSNSVCYYSRIDGSYIAHVSDPKIFKTLLRRGITEELQSSSKSGKVVSLGFNPAENKWYGWSHRAMFGFTIGSTCKRGDCHYRPKDKRDFIEDSVRFWDDPGHTITRYYETTQNGRSGVQIDWVYDDDIKNKKIRGKISGVFCEFPDTWGKGEWVAKSMDDAKQMAKDFASEVG